MHDRATTHDEFCSPDRNVISDRRVGACLGGNVYKKLSYRREAARCLVLLSTLVSR